MPFDLPARNVTPRIEFLPDGIWQCYDCERNLGPDHMQVWRGNQSLCVACSNRRAEAAVCQGCHNPEEVTEHYESCGKYLCEACAEDYEREAGQPEESRRFGE